MIEKSFPQDIIFLAGLLIIGKVTLKTILSVYSAFKTFCAPLIWPIDYKDKYGPWAVITGCSKGIGLCYAEELAKKKMNLILIARKVDLLNNIANQIRNQYQVQVEVIIADFGDENALYDQIEKRIAEKDIGILVNNVGVSNNKLKYFHDEAKEKMWNMINVNIAAMTMMTKIVLPRMEAKKKGAIINISSAASFGPNPFLTMYSATKAYVDFFSRGLAYEYARKGITVQSVCPGPVRTDMLYNIFKEKVENPGFKFFAPSAQTYTASAIKTLGFSSHTTGYWKHAILCCLQNPAVDNIRNRRMMYFIQKKNNEQKQKIVNKNENMSLISNEKVNDCLIILNSG